MLREVTKAVLATLRDTLRSRAALVAENTLLRQQVILLHRAAPHPRLNPRDRFIIGAITKLFPSLVAAVPIVRPDTVIRWHRSLWKLIWRRRSRRPVGRPPIDA
ncbi:MAG TPA: transposase, partial [Polyangia bacterium]|nr:transposase [Polyangia bacterium]